MTVTIPTQRTAPDIIAELNAKVAEAYDRRDETMIWYPHGDQENHPLNDGQRMTVSEARDHVAGFGTTGTVAIVRSDRVKAQSGRSVTIYHGLPFPAQQVTPDDAEAFRDRGEWTLTGPQHEALSAWLAAKADRAEGDMLRVVEQALMVALVAPVAPVSSHPSEHDTETI